MPTGDIGAGVSAAVLSGLASIVNFLPSFIGGLIVLVIGLVIAAVVQRVVLNVLKLVRLDDFLRKYGVYKVEGKEIDWTDVLAELARWFVIVVFLVPTVQTWGLGATTSVLNQVLAYIPRVAVAVILAILGLVFAGLSERVTLHVFHNLGRQSAHTAALVARWAILVFVTLAILAQLGVATDIIRIIVTGVIGMTALAGGLAFGLGGQGVARDLLEGLRKRLQR